MKLKFISAAIGSIFLVLSGTALAQTTLSAAVDHTIKTNPDIATDARHRRSVDEALIGAYSGYLPSVDAGWGEGREKAKNSNTGNRWSSYMTRREKSLTLQWNIFQTFGTFIRHLL